MTKGALSVALAACLNLSTSAAAFSVTEMNARYRTGTAVSAFGKAVNSRTVGLRVLFPVSSSRTKLSMVEDDDDDDVEEPLAQGVDSVSWLPTVVAAKTVETDSVAGEVRSGI